MSRPTKEEFRLKWSTWLAAHTLASIGLVLLFVSGTVLFGIKTLINVDDGAVRKSFFSGILLFACTYDVQLTGRLWIQGRRRIRGEHADDARPVR